MKLVVGIGNPGDRYADTRHNVGYDTVDLIARQYGAEFRKERFWNSLRARCTLGGAEVTLLKTLSFVNLTGPVVRKVIGDLDLTPADSLVVVDDFWLPLGRLRLRRSGGSGGHNGLDSLVRALGEDFPRLRIGIGSPERGDAVNHVLTRFRPEERELVGEAIDRAAKAVETWASRGIEEAMNGYNVVEE